MKEDRLDRISKRLQLKHLPLKKEWLRKCVEYLEKSLGSGVTSVEKIVDMIIQQFLYSQLSDTLNPLLKIPMNAVKAVIVKKMIFQVTSYVNISVPLYEQLSECTRHDDDLSWFHGGSKIEHDERETDANFHENNNNSSSNSKRRMLKLELTDGVNSVKAIELEEIFDEKLLFPGSKILLVGNVKCRRGTLLLDKSNCTFLGGRIDSLKTDKIKQLSDALKIDLDSENKRRKESLEKSASVVSRNHKRQQKNNSMNQSSISPFLVKTDRKTGLVTNPQKSAVPHLPESSTTAISDFSIEEVPQRLEPTPSPPKYRSFDTAEQEFLPPPTETEIPKPPPPPTKRLSSLKIGTQENPKQIPIPRSAQERKDKEWTVNATSFLDKEKSLNIGNPSEKKHPDKILPDELLEKEAHSVAMSTLGNPKMQIGKRHEINEWVWNSQKKSEDEKKLIEKKKNDLLQVLPPFVIKQKIERAFDETDPEINKSKISSFARTIHGPRQLTSSRPNAVNALKLLKNEEIKITNHFPVVKGFEEQSKLHSNSPNRAIIRPPEKIPEVQDVPTKKSRIEQLMEEEDDEDDDEDDEEEYRSMISQIMRPDHSKPPTLPAPPPRSSHIKQVGEDDSIMECTMEREGRQEQERWGLNNNRKRDLVELETVNAADPYSIKRRLGEEDYVNLMNRVIHSNAPTTAPPPTLTKTQEMPRETQAPPISNRIKIERTEEQEKGMSMMKLPSATAKKPGCSSQEEEVIKNKQSLNVQIYKTPFAKRITSSDESVTSQLFQRISDLNIVPLVDGLINRKFWMMSKIIVVMPTICHQLHELRSDGIDWILTISLTDTTASNVKCRVATDLLNRIFGFTVQQCKALFQSQKVEELRAKKIDAERKLLGFKRLDLLVWIEVSPDLEKQPLILDVKTISDALNIL